MDEGTQTEVVYANYAMAFDVACHKRELRQKREACGVTVYLLKRIETFLAGRTIQVELGKSFSKGLKSNN